MQPRSELSQFEIKTKARVAKVQGETLADCSKIKIGLQDLHKLNSDSS